MSPLNLLSIALIAPTVLGLPVPQYGWSGPVGTAALGGVTSSITTEHGGFSSAGPPQPVGYGYNYPSNNNNNGYNNGFRGGETSTTVTVSGPGGITASSQSYKKSKRHEPEQQQSQGSGSLSSSILGNNGYDKSSNGPVGTAMMGGVTSSINLGDH